MSFISTKMVCERCKCEFDMAFQIPDGIVSVYPNRNKYVMGTCCKNSDHFILSCSCKNCKQSIVKYYLKQDFDDLKIKFLD